MSPVNYRLELPTQWSIHPVFHIDLLTPYRETINQHAAFIDWCKGGLTAFPTPQLAYPRPNMMLCPSLTIYPSEKGITFDSLHNRYGAVDFQDALADFIVQHNYPELSTIASQRCTDNSLSKGFLCSTRSSLPILKTRLRRLLTLYMSNQGHVTIVAQGDLTPHL